MKVPIFCLILILGLIEFSEADFTYKGDLILPLACPQVDSKKRLPVGNVKNDMLDYGLSCRTKEEEYFRRFDGTCNNLKKPHWGRQYQAFRRLFPAFYPDETAEVRMEPNPRQLSLKLFPNMTHLDDKRSNLFMQMGQFLGHDMTLSLTQAELLCCRYHMNNPECTNFKSPKGDRFFKEGTCQPFIRTLPLCAKAKIREQYNRNTGFVDLSVVYGSDDTFNFILTDFNDGSKILEGEDFPGALPSQEQATGLEMFDDFMGRYLSGDIRANENPGLTSMHILFTREHNRLATQLKKNNPDLGEKFIYNLARRINIAEWQQVVWGEYLPIVLGKKLYAATALSSKMDSVYFNWINPGVLHSFATAALRFGHSMVNENMHKYRKGKKVGQFAFREQYLLPYAFEKKNAYNEIVEGMTRQKSEAFDPLVAEDVTDFLFKLENETFGEDLIARNILRGRDHGLAYYGDYRKFCGLATLTDKWSKKPMDITPENWNKLKKMYAKPTEIDLFVGALHEKPVKGGVVGPTFACLIYYQMFLSRYGDRFFFTHRCLKDEVEEQFPLEDMMLRKDLKGKKVVNKVKEMNKKKEATTCGLERFNKKERDAIRKRTLGDIICDNSDILKTPKNVLLLPGTKNKLINCKGRKPLNIKVFKTEA